MELYRAELLPVVHCTVDVRNAKAIKDKPSDLPALNHNALLRQLVLLELDRLLELALNDLVPFSCQFGVEFNERTAVSKLFPGRNSLNMHAPNKSFVRLNGSCCDAFVIVEFPISHATLIRPRKLDFG